MNINPQTRRIEIKQGEVMTSADSRITFSTVLGSCVAVCLLDPEAGVAGMNHYMSAIAPEGIEWLDGRYGSHSMAMLMERMFACGARRERLQAKVYGGSSTLHVDTDIGRANVDYAMGYLSDRSVPCFGGSVGGNVARRIEFVPGEARVSLKEYPVRMTAANNSEPPSSFRYVAGLRR